MTDAAEWELGVTVRKAIRRVPESSDQEVTWTLLVGRSVVRAVATSTEVEDIEALRRLFGGES